MLPAFPAATSAITPASIAAVTAISSIVPSAISSVVPATISIVPAVTSVVPAAISIVPAIVPSTISSVATVARPTSIVSVMIPVSLLPYRRVDRLYRQNRCASDDAADRRRSVYGRSNDDRRFYNRGNHNRGLHDRRNDNRWLNDRGSVDWRGINRRSVNRGLRGNNDSGGGIDVHVGVHITTSDGISNDLNSRIAVSVCGLSSGRSRAEACGCLASRTSRNSGIAVRSRDRTWTHSDSCSRASHNWSSVDRGSSSRHCSGGNCGGNCSWSSISRVSWSSRSIGRGRGG